MRWFYFGVVPVGGLLSSAGLVIAGLLAQSWGLVVFGAILSVSMTLFVRKLPQYKARETSRRRASQRGA